MTRPHSLSAACAHFILQMGDCHTAAQWRWSVWSLNPRELSPVCVCGGESCVDVHGDHHSEKVQNPALHALPGNSLARVGICCLSSALIGDGCSLSSPPSSGGEMPISSCPNVCVHWPHPAQLFACASLDQVPTARTGSAPHIRLCHQPGDLWSLSPVA